MKPIIRVIAFILIPLLLWSAATLAQDEGIKVGVGLGIDPPRLFMASSNIYSNVLTPVNIYVPISGQNFRFEPDLGIWSFTYESSTAGVKNTSDASIFHVGAGAFYLMPTSDAARLYVGPRFGLNFISQKSSNTYTGSTQSSETTETDFSVALCFGGEYSCAKQFSVGGEAQASYYSFGKPETTITPSSGTSGITPDITHHLISTNVVVFLRWFF